MDEVRVATKEEKKKLAMAMRAKQLKSIGLKTNEKGQVKAESALLEQFQAIGEESGLVCVICREGYRLVQGYWIQRMPIVHFKCVSWYGGMKLIDKSCLGRRKEGWDE